MDMSGKWPGIRIGSFPASQTEKKKCQHRFAARDTVTWFESRGVQFITEPDGRLFPRSNTSQTIIDCLVHTAQKAGVEMRVNSGVASIERRPNGGFAFTLTNGEVLGAARAAGEGAAAVE